MNILRRSSGPRLTHAFRNEGIEFSFASDQPVKLPLSDNTPEILSLLMADGSAWSALEELWTDEVLTAAGHNTWLAPYLIFEIYEESEDVDILLNLNLPVPQPLESRIETHSNVGQPDFRVVVEVVHPDSGTLRDGDHNRIGPAIFLDEYTVLPLRSKLRKLLDSARGDGVDWEDLNSRMGYLANVREAALLANSKLDPYLENEQYSFVDTCGLDVKEDAPDKITLIPDIPNINKYSSSGGEALIAGRIPQVLTKPERTGKRSRLVLSRNLRESLKALPERGLLTGTDVPKLLTSPEQYIPEGFDLSLFSERVKGLRTQVYNSRPYIHVRRATGGWFEGVPGLNIETGTGSEEPSFQLDPSESTLSPETLKKLREQASESGEEWALHKGNWIHFDPDEMSRFDKALEQLEPKGDGSFIIPADAILEIYDNLLLLEFIDHRGLEEIKNTQDVRPALDLPAHPPPTAFKGKLPPYQLEGYRWLSRLESLQAGGLLADDMGVGKTVQVIAHLLRQKEKGIEGPHLIVVPKTLIDNWMSEINKFSGGTLNVQRYEGWSRTLDSSQLERLHVVLTTYDTLRRDQVKLGTVNWRSVICDEAQYVKNPTTQRTTAIKAMKSHHRIAMTGTPVENGLIEFWCIMDFVQPGLVGSWSDFRTEFERPIALGNEEEREPKVEELLNRVAGHYLRRMKDKILPDLPPKQIHRIQCGISESQMRLYRIIANRGKSGGRGAALAAIQRLLMICAHPHAIDPAQFDIDESSVGDCPKLNVTLDIIEEVKGRAEKVIIFTDYKRVQRKLRDVIRERFDVWPDIINGELTGNRQKVIEFFSQVPGFNVLILGHQVGGVGLNITAANNVIHYTRPWNPAKENQATDRVHRIGQTSPVNVYYPIVTDEEFTTVEDRLDEVIRSKEGLARDVLRPSAAQKVRPDDLLECLIDVEDVPEVPDESESGIIPEPLDLDLFEDSWQSLISSLLKREGISVDAGGDVDYEGRVVGEYAASVWDHTTELMLVEEDSLSAKETETALSSQGRRVLKINPEDPSAERIILRALEE